jgi:4'-phosphopantetheinyl transferase EntD
MGVSMRDTSGTETTTRQPFGDVMERLFPPFVRGALTEITATCRTPFPEEEAAIAGAGPRRRQEFLCGRVSAHVALAALGRDEGPVPVGDRRQPLWPDGVVGSISHAGGWAGAVVAAADDATALGFDIEVLEPPLDTDVDRLVRTPAELAQSAPGDHPLAKVVFSVKETVFKALFPSTGVRLAFDDVEVRVDLPAGRWDARVRGSDELSGRLAIAHGYLFTGLCLPLTG